MTLDLVGGIVADVWIENDKIAGLTHPSARASMQPGPDVQQIDAKGQYVIPGVIDCHTHMDLPFGGTMVSDDFDTGTVAAAHGGTTTIVDFAIQSKAPRCARDSTRGSARTSRRPTGNK